MGEGCQAQPGGKLQVLLCAAVPLFVWKKKTVMISAR